MENKKFIFVGHVASFGELALRNGDAFDADPEVVREKGLPAVPADMLHVGYTVIEAGIALVNFHLAKDIAETPIIPDPSLPQIIPVPVPHPHLSNAAVGEGLVSESNQEKE
jgi:hypothetical protein